MKNRTLLLIGLPLVALIAAAVYYLASPLFIDRAVDEAFPLPDATALAAMDDGELAAVEAELMATAAAMPDKMMAEPMPAEQPAALRQGQFAGADSFHQGRGTATVYDLGNGRLVLRLDDFEVTNGPDLHVLLATSANPTGRGELGEYIDLGPLKGNIGSQNYDLPAGLDLSPYQSVIIYCLPFHVIFATAVLS